ncbi:glutamine-hydrolyzing carbamoyl-phosphate synthase small subunit [Polynucleobacter sp. MWH-UH24A]|uniref:glutamine-hydrolyzing carbamoyl-phosphate synthase small subunit n=1 Tax=Polynucleobacter sp. MWH-UH24A TaxID=2689110 RepID=UPI001BFE7991|nr:glutamine-hydrolyzing carbamoyl-phosphate synthase small subunit [Polynucleobacter sp. MWH-UH24A]QWD75458.1 glutamine-hydrolyzing carbamoyl-phosphate synthase small subunit [Polynucleobacter sp. MWH-UH24A]
MLPSFPPAVLALADGSIFSGQSIGAPGETSGEVVFNTALTGYQEIITDPSYARQLVTLTYPHIGNVGVNAQDAESAKIYAAGLIIKDLSARVSNFRAEDSLDHYLRAAKVPGIAGIDTRKLTRLLRDRGAQSGAIVAGKIGDDVDALAQRALTLAKAFSGMAGLDLAQVVTTPTPYEWQEGEWQLHGEHGKPAFRVMKNPSKRVVAYDFGVKRNILRMLAERGCALTVVPAKTPVAEVLALKPDGVFLSNGPGDPEPCDYAISAAQTVISKNIPTFGICLGHQIMGLAAGAKTLKMKFGHHGANHPVKDLDSGRVAITSQNHGFAVDAKTLPADLRVTHISLFDGSLQGLAWKDKPAFCFQGHPEASPGPHDIAYLFDRFMLLMNAAGQGAR